MVFQRCLLMNQLTADEIGIPVPLNVPEPMLDVDRPRKPVQPDPSPIP